MKLRILFAALGMFALVSGWVKCRARVRERMGGSGLGVVEGVLGLVLLLSQAPGLANEGLRVGLAWATFGVMIASNAYAVVRATRYSRGLGDSEGHRLYTKIKFEEALENAQVRAADPPSEYRPDPELPS